MYIQAIEWLFQLPQRRNDSGQAGHTRALSLAPTFGGTGLVAIWSITPHSRLTTGDAVGKLKPQKRLSEALEVKQFCLPFLFDRFQRFDCFGLLRDCCAGGLISPVCTVISFIEV